ncbi:MAG: 50S ribosome-binding GTPase, partial [Nitrospira sp.]|nr:50S ribosome-binding GTPase [Nitrospira sp.]
IAEYPFTTLAPHLGVVHWGSDRSFVVADIPGLIEGAHDGKGLGLQFLRHIERTAFLLHLIDVSEWTPVEPIAGFETMRRELAAYDHTLIDRPFAVVATKIDIGGTSDRLARLRDYCKHHRLRCFPVSSATREGLDDLIAFVGAQVDRLRSRPCETKS